MDKVVLFQTKAADKVKLDLEARGAEVVIEVQQCETCGKFDYFLKTIWPTGKIWGIQGIETV